MASLQLAHKARATASANPSARLYRSIVKELPRVLTIYDIDMPLKDAKDNIRAKFQQYAHIKDDRVKGMLVEKGYMDLEETLLQHKQRGHLLRAFAGYIEPSGSSRKRLGKDPSIDEQFARSY
uniref:NADH dehydrogenase [ubiquinone] 1 alpha subcomplex subunit 6 n=1 Tax=Eucampia antarctica TaxID=49252 RepID=A0A7S2S5W3_9STRA|eukprot:CAMPEP_0197833826 /NCGR_PEP_ID=MMETSP1437-20131217/20218_1 /TAXON_ID=49252 ORGANISM="Eucampia antarctica, Strain CCMP1452" /NCGR_SAMPLE_ID=MMETSP1437 /ASSEMBLY_ACC=CAM_ASM_001096 /LENGTH=122 /DNA_ID=CAMNT_0043438101 /DNA_START=31 /DNA_END=399 /DNA_ORIENTATION=+